MAEPSHVDRLARFLAARQSRRATVAGGIAGFGALIATRFGGAAARLPASATPGASPIASPEPAFAPLTAEALQQLASGLPESPVDAAMALVDIAFDGDDNAALVATAEMLRRCGLPVVSTGGAVIGLPDDLVWTDATIYDGVVQSITEHLREHSVFALADAGQALALFGFADADGNAFDDKVYASFFAKFGKSSDSPAEYAFAGAMIRAISARRNALFYPSNTDATVDWLQLLPILAYTVSDISLNKSSTLDTGSGFAGVLALQDDSGGTGEPGDAGDNGGGSGGATGNGGGRDDTASGDDSGSGGGGPCDDLAADMKNAGQVGSFAKGLGKKGMKDAINDVLGKGAASAFGDVSTAESVTADLLTAALLLIGAKIKIEADKPQTHFKHEDGESGKDITFTASAWFDPNLAAGAIACFQLAGVKIPQPGGSGFKGWPVHWGIVGDYLQTTSADASKVQQPGPGDLLDGNGQSTFETEPPVENKPPQDGEDIPVEEHTVWVKCALDKKNDAPFSAADLVSLLNIEGIPEKLLYKLVTAISSWLAKVSLPTAWKQVTVEQHAPDIYTLTGKTDTATNFLTTDWGWSVDVYTCKGLDDVWKGNAEMHVDTSFLVQLGEQITGLGKPSAAASKKVEGYLTGGNFILINDPDVGEMSVQFDIPQKPKAGEHVLGQVGTATIWYQGMNMDKECGISGLCSGATYPIVGVDEHDGCPGSGKFHWDAY